MAHAIEETTIRSGGAALAAWLLRPTGADAEHRTSCVVMAHGFSATRRDGLLAFAEPFADAGHGVLAFDYRGFGDSGGEPRQVVDVAGQQDDYRAAIEHARRLEWVDPERIALWGSSLSGGHVVDVAAGDDRLAAAIAQAPFADGLAQLRAAAPWIALRGTLDALLDIGLAALGGAPRMIAAVGPPGSYAVLTAPEAEPGFRAIVGADSRWRNAVAARVLLRLVAWRPVRAAGRVSCPLFVCVCERDATTPPGGAIRMAELAPRGELARYPIGHFDIYEGEPLRRAVADQIAFLARVLPRGG